MYSFFVCLFIGLFVFLHKTYLRVYNVLGYTLSSRALGGSNAPSCWVLPRHPKKQQQLTGQCE